MTTPSSSSGHWWAVTGSNRRPSRCKRDALPTELTARRAFLVSAPRGLRDRAAPMQAPTWRKCPPRASALGGELRCGGNARANPRHHSFFVERGFKGRARLKPCALRRGNLISSPVAGLRPLPAARFLTEKVPNPTSRTSSPFLSALVIPSITASSAAAEAAFDVSVAAAMCSTNSNLLTMACSFFFAPIVGR